MTTIDETELQKLRDANTKGIVLGLKAFASVKPRLDIDDLLAQLPKAFNLFLIALDDLQKDKSKTGYAQIAGIHGLPRASWDGFGTKMNVIKDVKYGYAPSGYCAHGEERFPTWHRPYLALLEQTLFIRVIDLARSFTGSLKDDYLREALQFRLPYWDYYRPRGGPVEFPGVIDKGTTTFDWDYSIPRVFTEKSLRVRRPPGNQIDTLERNPLNFFDLKSANIIPDDDWKMYGKVDLFPRDRTVRYRLPNSTSDTDSTTVANSTINELRMDSNRLMLNMLSNKETDVYNNYDVFSTNKKGTPTVAKPPQDAKEAEKTMWYGSGSLEALHGIYHVIIGGLPNINTKTWAGHMTQVPVAAFDPIFWVHHCQIDRVFALWQATHNRNKPEEWFGNQSLSTKPLLPFRIKNDNNDPTVCWNSNQSRQCGTFGYDYPEILAGGDVLTTVRKMYEWSVNLTAAGDFGDIPSNMKPAPISNAEIWLPGATSDLLSATNPGRPKAPKPQFFAQMRTQNIALPPAEVALSREWYIDDEVERLALNGSFTIFYFLNDLDSSLNQDTNLATEPTLVGLTHVFAAPVEYCDNCGEQSLQGNVVTNTVPITSMLLDYVETGALQSLHPDDVGPFLIRTLRWRIVTTDALPKDPRELAREKAFKVNISCKKAKLPRNSDDEVQYEEYPSWIEQITGNASTTQSS